MNLFLLCGGNECDENKTTHMITKNNKVKYFPVYSSQRSSERQYQYYLFIYM